MLGVPYITILYYMPLFILLEHKLYSLASEIIKIITASQTIRKQLQTTAFLLIWKYQFF